MGFIFVYDDFAFLYGSLKEGGLLQEPLFVVFFLRGFLLDSVELVEELFSFPGDPVGQFADLFVFFLHGCVVFPIQVFILLVLYLEFVFHVLVLADSFV